MRGLTRLRGRSPSGEAQARASIDLRKSLSKEMDCRVKPGNDGNEVKNPGEFLRGFVISMPSGHSGASPMGPRKARPDGDEPGIQPSRRTSGFRVCVPCTHPGMTTLGSATLAPQVRVRIRIMKLS
jgi:hypothetical protein